MTSYNHENGLKCNDKYHAESKLDLNQSCCVRYASPAGNVTVGNAWNYQGAKGTIGAYK